MGAALTDFVATILPSGRVSPGLLLAGGLLAAGLLLGLGRRWVRASLAVAGLATALSGQWFLLCGRFHTGIPLLLAGSLAAAAASSGVARDADRPEGAPWSRSPHRHSLWVGAFLVVLALTLLTRCYRLDNFEQRLCFSRDSTIDVAYKGEWAMDFLAGAPYTPFIQHWGERETLYVYIEALFILLFGQNLVSLTLVSILCGFFTVVSSVFLVQRLFGPGTGLLTGCLLALSPWLIATNRISERFNLVPFFTSLALLTLLAALQEKRPWRMILGGLVLGIGLWSFPSYRVVPILAAAGWGLWLLFERDRRRRLLGGAALYWSAFGLAALAPLRFSLRGFVDHYVLAREHGFKMFTHAEDIWRYLGNLIGFFHYRFRGDMSYWSDHPLLHPVLGVFLLVGLFLVILRPRRRESLLLLIGLAVSLLPVLVSDPVPRRMGVALVLIYVLVAHGMVEFGKRLVSGVRRWQGPWLVSGCAALCLAVGTADIVRLFTVDYDVRGRRPCALFRMQEFVKTVGPHFSTYTTHMGEAQQLLRFYKHSAADDANDYEGQVLQPMDEIPLHRRPDRDVLIVIGPEPHYRESIPYYRQRYPGALVVEHRSGEDEPLFTSLFVRKEEVESHQGLGFRWTREHGTSVQELPRLEAGFPSGIPPELPVPLHGTWHGSLFVPAAGVVRFRFSGTADTDLQVDGRRVPAVPDGEDAAVCALFLFKGNHEVRIGIRARDRRDRLQVEVQFPGREFTPFPREFFMPYAPPDDRFRAPRTAAGPLQFEPVLQRRFASPFVDEDFVPRRMAVDGHGRLFLADSERMTIVRVSPEREPDLAFTPFSDPVARWSGRRPFSGERHRGILLRVTGRDELTVVDRSRNVVHGFDLDGNRRWRTEPAFGPVQGILDSGDEEDPWFLVGLRPARLDREELRLVPLAAWDGPLEGYFDVQAAARDPRRDTVSFHDGAYETVLNFTRGGQPLGTLYNLGRHDDVRMEFLPDGLLLFSGLRTHNVYACAAQGTCFVGEIGDPPVNILGWDRFGLITDMAVGAGGETVYVIDFDGLVQGFARVRP